MYNIFCGCPFLSLLFLFAAFLGLSMEHRLLKRQQVQASFYRRIMLFGPWLMLVPIFAILWLVSTEDRHGTIRFVSVQGVFLILALVHNAVLKPVYRNYRRMALDQSAYSVWGR